MNSKKRGDVGLGAAIAYFTSKGMTVSIPLTDSQDYDLVIDTGTTLERVQVKTCSCRDKNKFTVGLRTSGGNRSWNGVTKKFNKEKAECLFVLLDDGRRYCIPTSVIDGKSKLNPECSKCAKFQCG